MSEWPPTIPRLDEDAIAETVMGLVGGRIFTATQLPEGENLSLHFMPLIAGWGDLDVKQVGNVIADLGDRAEVGINGYPVFFKCRIIHRDDWAVIADRTLAADYLMREAAGGGDFAVIKEGGE
jgi:hypothetical protein